MTVLRSALVAAVVLAPAAAAQGGEAPLVRQVVASVGSDPVSLAGWVAEHVALDPYPGAMRGAEGSLHAAAASAGDMALLLHALVTASEPGAELRFARCALGDAEVERSLAASAAAPERPRPWLERIGDSVDEIDDAEIRASAAGIAALWRDLTATVARHVARLDAALAGQGLRVAPAAVPASETRAAIADHVWLQARRGDGWLDLDPTSEGGGSRRCEPAATSTDFPSDLLARVMLSVVAETRGAGDVARAVLLEADWPVAELARAPGALAFAEAFGDELTTGREPTASGLLRYTPVILAGDTTLLGEPFWLPVPASLEIAEPADGAGGMGGAIGGIAGGLFGRPAPAEPAPEPDAGPADDGLAEAAALTLVVTVTTADGRQQRVERALFDRVGYAARAAGLAASAGLEDLHEVEGEYRALATVWSLAVWTGSWSYGQAGPPGEGEGLGALVAGLHGLHGTFEVVREALYRSAVPAEDGPRYSPRRPGLSLLAWRPGDATDATLLMDVLIDPAEAVGGAGDTSSAALARAVSAVAAERLLVGLERLLLPHLGEEDDGGGHAVDVLAVVDAADEQGIELLWLGAGDGASGVAASPEATARIDAHLREGRVLLVPERPVLLGDGSATGWWMVDPGLEAIRDQMETGGHQAVEYPITTQPGRQAAPVLRRSLARRIVCSIGRAVVALDLLAALSGVPGAGGTARGIAEGVAAVREAAEKTRNAGKSVGGACNAASGPPR